MKVKNLAGKIKELNIEGCTSCPFNERTTCKIHGNICISINNNIDNAKGLLQLEHFFKTGEVKEILEGEK
jgi:hypothetical protein